MTGRKILVLVAVAVLAAVSVVVLWALGWTQRGTLGLDIVLWLISWFLLLAVYWGLPAEKPPVGRKVGWTVLIIVLGLVFTYLFRYVTPGIVGGSVDEYPLMSLTFVAWTLVFIMLFIWLKGFIRAL